MLLTLRCDEAHAASVLVLLCFRAATFAAGNVAFLLCGRQAGHTSKRTGGAQADAAGRGRCE
ncbi:hypothetical protein CKAH01_11326 [Colletotrichum kahawae]|uniref:Uncharacterized protein n=1 Tax=Colletotrichum kahawae TaxID=34407 RepID=A0AAD9YY68_COLKA|nr:hypothetical protein CKAH01_11326 [Colletotrichum kahawae]